MKKFLRSFAALFVAISLTVFVAGCKDGGDDPKPDPDPVNVTVTFDAGAGSFSNDAKTVVRTIEKGKTAEAPLQDPELANYTFKGWFTQVDGQGTAHTATTTHDVNTTYHAFWDITVKIPVKFGTTTVNAGLVVVGSGAEIETVELSGNVVGYSFARTDAGHQSSYSWFKVDLGAKKLTDYEAVEFDFEITGLCESSSRRPSLIASVTEDFSDVELGGSGTGGPGNHWSTNQVTYVWNASYTLVNDVGSAGISNAIASAVKVKLPINLAWAMKFDASSVLTLSLYEHNSSGASHKITNITFIERPVLSDEDTVKAVKEAIEGITQAQLTVAQVVLNTEAEAKAFVEALDGTLFLDGVGVELETVSFKAAVAGEKDGDIMGTNGQYDFTLSLSKGTASDTVQKTLIITATPGLEPGDKVWTLKDFLAANPSLLDTRPNPQALEMLGGQVRFALEQNNIALSTSTGNNTIAIYEVDGDELVVWLNGSSSGGMNINLTHADGMALDLANIEYKLSVVYDVVRYATNSLTARTDNISPSENRRWPRIDSFETATPDAEALATYVIRGGSSVSFTGEGATPNGSAAVGEGHFYGGNLAATATQARLTIGVGSGSTGITGGVGVVLRIKSIEVEFVGLR